MIELYELVEYVCNSYGSCSVWSIAWDLTWDQCLREARNYYGEGTVSCIFTELAENL